MKEKTKNIVFIVLGLIVLAIGLVGVVLPILPTTPFLLLAAFLFLHSSKKLHTWLLTRRIIGTHIKNYQQYHAIKKRTKIIALTYLWVTLAASCYFVPIWAVRGLLVLIGSAVTVHLYKMKTMEQIEIDSEEVKEL